jgi:hypothetical protein
MPQKKQLALMNGSDEKKVRIRKPSPEAFGKHARHVQIDKLPCGRIAVSIPLARLHKE